MEKVIFKKEVLDYFEELIYVLFGNDYFIYPENAENYVGSIIDFVIEEIDSFPHETAPRELSHLGKYYIFYKCNKRTTWFIFFEKQMDRYLVTSILNNHCKEAKLL